LEDISYNISLFRDEAFQSTIEFKNESGRVSEDGSLIFYTELHIRSFVTPGVELELESAIQGIIQSLYDTTCRLWGDRTVITSNPREEVFDTNHHYCGSNMTIEQRGSIILVTATMDMTPYIIPESGRAGMPLYLLGDNPAVVIKFIRYPTNMYLSHTIENISIKRSNSESPYLPGGGCDHKRESSVFLESAIDWGKLADCLASVEDNESVDLVGLQFAFVQWESQLNKPFNVRILCPVEHIPRSLYEWNYPSSECREIENYSYFQMEKRFYSIQVQMISCDLRCTTLTNQIEYIPSSEFEEESRDSPLIGHESSETKILIGALIIIGFMVWLILKSGTHRLFPSNEKQETR
jgi:hypothetical protein